MHPLVNIAKNAAFAAGEVITRHLYKLNDLNVTEKEANHFVSEVDIKAEHIIMDTIRKAYPDHAILTEESGYHAGEGNEECVWIIDPLDGTHNYLHGLPYYCVSIAVQIKNRIEHAVVYDPSKDECFTATRGGGAQCNDRRIRVSSRSLLKEALLSSSFSYTPESQEKYLAAFREFFGKCLGLRRMGSAALDLAYVAAGRIDGLWGFGLQPWDVAAGSLLIKESGGLVGDLQGTEDFMKKYQIAAGNPKIFKALLQTMKPVI
jgi:myo-inositol-1(or 4)-monophosphatase